MVVGGVTGDRVEVVDPEGVGEGGDSGGLTPIRLSAKFKRFCSRVRSAGWYDGKGAKKMVVVVGCLKGVGEVVSYGFLPMNADVVCSLANRCHGLKAGGDGAGSSW